MTRTVAGRLPGARRPRVSGRVPIPGSKSHTIRALLIAALADGESRLIRPLASLDTLSCRRAVEALGATVSDESGDWIVAGCGPVPRPAGGRIDVGNSGTTLYLATAMAALADRPVVFDGDEQTRRRSAGPLLDALGGLGAGIAAESDGCPPYRVTGPLKAGSVSMDCPVSQYLSALLLAAPLVGTRGREKIVQINVGTLNEAPYAGITLDWLEYQGIRFDREGWKRFRIPTGQRYRAFSRVVPADWSSATFFLAAAAITGGELVLEGLDVRDSQGDKAALDMFDRMGCRWEETEGGIRIRGGRLSGTTLDLNATPDALPAMAAAACFAEGETRLVNVPQARMKETDRIAVMCGELGKLGAEVRELEDGIAIRGRPAEAGKAPLTGGAVDGHDDHRVVMALAAAALGCGGELSIRGAEAADVTFPGFFDLLAGTVD